MSQLNPYSASSRKLQLLIPKDRVTAWIERGQCFLMKLQLPQLKVSSATSRKLQLLLPKDRVTECSMKLQLPQLKGFLCYIQEAAAATSNGQSDCRCHSSSLTLLHSGSCSCYFLKTEWLHKLRGGQKLIMKLHLPQLKASSATSRKLQLLLPKDRVGWLSVSSTSSASSTLQSDVALFSSTCYFHLVWQKILTKKRQLCPRMIVIKFLLIQPKNNLWFNINC